MSKILSAIAVILSVIFMSPINLFKDIFIKQKADFPETENMCIVFDEPASKTSKNDTWQRATLPIGNGKIAANIYGETEKDILTFNEETLWSGGRCSDIENDNYNGGNPLKSPKEIYDEISAAVLNGESFDPERLRGTADGYGAYEPFADVHFNFDGSSVKTPGDYIRKLDLENGTANVSYTQNGMKFSREYIASNPQNVIAVHLTCDKPALGFTLSVSSKQNGNAAASCDGQRGSVSFSGKLQNGLKFAMNVGISADGNAFVTRTGNKIKVTFASDVLICISGNTDYSNSFYNSDKSVEYYYRSGETENDVREKANTTVSDALKIGWSELLSEHIKDYRSLYSRVNLSFGQKNGLTTDELLSRYQKNNLTAEQKKYLEVLMFQYGRYLLISSSRENSVLPTNLQGIWNEKKSPPWGSDMHLNINEQMNYWLCGVCNLNECELPLVRYVSSLKYPGGKTVKTYTGSDHGIMAHTQNTPYGFTAPGWVIGTWGWSPAAATWIMQNCFDYYEYTGDKAVLKELIYPMLKQQVLMYGELLREKDGRLVMPIAQSPEINIISAGNTYEQSIIFELYSDTVKAAEILGDDKDFIDMMKATLEKLKPIEIGASGQIKEWYSENEINSVSDTRKHRHLSNLLGLYPGTLFDTEEKLSAATVSLLNKQFGHTGTTISPEGGWTYAQLMGSWARVHSGENAYFSLSSMIKNKLYTNLWDFHNAGTYGAFQIDANFGYSAGMGEMLLQSHLGYVELLPAVPAEWKNGEFSGLLAQNNFEISAKWSDCKPEKAEIISHNGGVFSIKSENAVCVTDMNGKPVAVNALNGIYSFDTVKGQGYKLIF